MQVHNMTRRVESSSHCQESQMVFFIIIIILKKYGVGFFQAGFICGFFYVGFIKKIVWVFLGLGFFYNNPDCEIYKLIMMSSRKSHDHLDYKTLKTTPNSYMKHFYIKLSTQLFKFCSTFHSSNSSIPQPLNIVPCLYLYFNLMAVCLCCLYLYLA